MLEDELDPIIFMNFPNAIYNPYLDPSVQFGMIGPGYFQNKTVVDNLFGWGEEYGQAPPVFAKLPLDYNTILDHTGNYGREAVYLLGKGAPGSDYLLCSIKAYRSPACSTGYNVSSSGAQLSAVCENEEDQMQYIRNIPLAAQGNATISTDWVSAATDWADSLSLNAGITDGNASNARLLMQLMLAQGSTKLNPVLPSPAEALAVMAGCTLLMGTQDAEILDYWNYTGVTTLEPGRYETFRSTIRAQQYASGGSKGYQHGFFAVLVLVFALNVLCLGYLLFQRGMVTDFSEPVNLFSLAINSPPSEVMAGSCGAGPQGMQYRVPWFLNAAGDHRYIESSTVGLEGDHELTTPRSESSHAQLSPVRRAFERLTKRPSARTSLL